MKRLTLALCFAYASVLSCATTAGKEASAIATKCGMSVAADVVVAVSTGLDTSTAALEADAVKYGVPLVLCVIEQLVVLNPPASTTARLPEMTARQKNAAEFMAAHR